MDIQNIADCPTLPAVKNRQQLERALKTDNEVIFLLFGDILSVAELTESIHRAGKRAIVHLDLIGGLGSREVAVDFIARTTKADGIISTKGQLIRTAREMGLVTVQRFFALDSKGMESIEETLHAGTPHLMEIMPGVITKAIRRFQSFGIPVIAGGLLEAKTEVTEALSAGAAAISTGAEALWYL